MISLSLLFCRVVGLWREDLSKTNPKAAQSIADPADYENLFPDLQQSLKAEQYLKRERLRPRPAADYRAAKVFVKLHFLVKSFYSTLQSNEERNIIEEMEQAMTEMSLEESQSVPDKPLSKT